MNFTKFIGGLLILFFFGLLLPFSVFADGTVAGTVVGPHGETAVVSYSFSKTGSTVTGTTALDGTFSQTLTNGDWALTFTPPASFTYADTFTIPRIRIENSDSFNLGTIQFHFQVPAGTDADLENFATVPAICSQSGDPVIIRAYYEDEAKGSFLYAGRSANVIVVADATNYTVEVDYSYIEGDYSSTPFSNANTVTAVHQGNGKYKATHTVVLTTMGGGMPLIKVTPTAGTPTYTCLTGGPVNLDIRTMLNGSDTTNFSAVTDFRAITNFTMHYANIVKVVFTRSVNMLDPTVQRFMKSIASKMVSSTGLLTLDARAVLELKNAGASITMYNINLNSPKILVDGVEDSSVTTGIVYDSTAKTLTFNAAHFTTFRAVENSSSSGGTASPKPPACSDFAPSNTPHLFQIDTTKNTAKLFFTPANDYLSYYYIAYGLSLGDERYGVSFNHGLSGGVVEYNINALEPNTNYYFKVRGGNGCASGGWSNILSAKTDGFNNYVTGLPAVLKVPAKTSLKTSKKSKTKPSPKVKGKKTTRKIKGIRK